jgi:4-hydroxy-tetrahydrodipicolinate synthase
MSSGGKMPTECYTALITPFKNDAVDEEGLSQLTTFQIKNGISGILAVGTTGESPVLNWEEHNLVIEKIAVEVKDKCICIAGTGSNNTAEALEGSRHAVAAGVDALLLVDPYYNGPSSLEIRREYVAPIAAAFPDTRIIPYVIPGRTGAQLLPEDLALLSQQYANVDTVKEATADLANMRRTRECCGPDFTILSGDDGLTYEMMSDPDIGAAGVISVVSNVAPRAVAEMVRCHREGEKNAARQLNTALTPLFGLVTVKTTEQTPFGEAMCRARNPVGIKTLMTILGMPSGGCRQPLGKMSQNGLNTVIETARRIHANNPEILQPVADFFNVDISARLNDSANWDGLYYENY